MKGALVDLQQLTDDDLDTLRRDVLIEQERRHRLAQAPDQVASLAADYEKDGGDRAELVSAITERTDQ